MYHRLTVIASVFLLVSRLGAQGLVSADELYQQALVLERRTPPDLAQAARLYQRASEHGHAHAKVRLGQLFQTGRGVQSDPGRAVELYREAAVAKDADGQVLLGLAYLSGLGGRKDAGEARVWFRQAAQSGDQRSQLLLGLLLRDGEGGHANEIAAGRWFSRAAEGPDKTLSEKARALRDKVQQSANTRDESDPRTLLAGIVAVFLFGLAAHALEDGSRSPTGGGGGGGQECMAKYAHLGILEAQFLCLGLD